MTTALQIPTGLMRLDGELHTGHGESLQEDEDEIDVDVTIPSADDGEDSLDGDGEESSPYVRTPKRSKSKTHGKNKLAQVVNHHSASHLSSTFFSPRTSTSKPKRKRHRSVSGTPDSQSDRRESAQSTGRKKLKGSRSAQKAKSKQKFKLHPRIGESKRRTIYLSFLHLTITHLILLILMF